MNKDIDRQVRELAKVKKFHIPIGCGRPNRETVISEEEIMNLKIDLGLCENSGEFEKSIVYNGTPARHNEIPF
jgi:hypothetical protein